MDLFSYLLGKGSGGGGSSKDWSAIGFQSEPACIQDGYDYALQIKNNWASPVIPSFYKDYNLIYMPLVVLNSSTTNMSSMFSNCISLNEIALLDTSKITNMSNMFYNCTTLKTIPLLDTSKVTNMSGMFQNCSTLKSIPLIDTSSVTNMSSMFINCLCLTEIPQLDTSNLTTATSMFGSCEKLETIPLLDFGKVTGVNGIFTYANKLKDLGGFKDLGKAYSPNSGANFIAYKLDVSNSANTITHDSIMNIINNLYDIASAGIPQQTLNLGSAKNKISDAEKQIAIDKGWQIT